MAEIDYHKYTWQTGNSPSTVVGLEDGLFQGAHPPSFLQR